LQASEAVLLMPVLLVEGHACSDRRAWRRRTRTTIESTISYDIGGFPHLWKSRSHTPFLPVTGDGKINEACRAIATGRTFLAMAAQSASRRLLTSSTVHNRLGRVASKPGPYFMSLFRSKQARSCGWRVLHHLCWLSLHSVMFISAFSGS
jgi:hypothetical protein